MRFKVGIMLCVLFIGFMGRLNAFAGQSRGQDLTIAEIKMLAAAMELENGCNSDRCLMLTGSVILNRVNSPEWPNTIYSVLHQKGQYAEWTLRHLDTVRVSDRVMSLALKLVMCGSMDTEIIFQSMHPELGKVKYKVDTDYFATKGR